MNCGNSAIYFSVKNANKTVIYIYSSFGKIDCKFGLVSRINKLKRA